MPVPKVWATPPKYAPRDAFPAVAEACGRIQELDEAKRGFESPNLTWLPPRTRAALRFGTGRGGCNDVQRERLRACRGLWDGRARMQCRPKASRARGFCLYSSHGSFLAPGRAALADRLGCSEQRGSASPLKVRPPPPLRNIERRRSETWAARRACRPKHGSITFFVLNNQDDLKLLWPRVAARLGVLPPCCCQRSERDLARLERSPEGFAGGLAALSILRDTASLFVHRRVRHCVALATNLCWRTLSCLRPGTPSEN